MSGVQSRSTFTGRMRDAEKVVRSMPSVSAAEFRVLTAIMSGINEATGIFKCSDEVLAVMSGYRQRQSLSAARAGLKAKGIIHFVPGRPGHLTAYRLALSDQDVLDGLALLSDAKTSARTKLKSDSPRRIGVKDHLRRKSADHVLAEVAEDDRRKELATLIVPAASASVYAAASMDVYTVLPRHTPIEASSTDERLVSERAREVAYPDGDDLAFMTALGEGDTAEGRDLADYLPGGMVTDGIERLRQFGLQQCLPHIRYAREQATARRGVSQRAAS